MAPSHNETPDIRHLMAAQERGDQDAAEQIAAELHEKEERIEASTPASRIRTLRENIARRDRFIQNARREIQELQSIPGIDEAVQEAIAGKEEVIRDFEALNAKNKGALLTLQANRRYRAPDLPV